MLRRVASYERRVGASVERVWENVRDWEHLPWLHASSFRSIGLIEAGDTGWKARIGLPDAGEITLELVIDAAADRYVSRTLEGPGAGTEIWTQVRARADDATDIEVSFDVPGVEEDAADAVGGAFRALYTRLWDEDEAMMRMRARALARVRTRSAAATVRRIDLGARARLRLPLRVEVDGQPLCVGELDGELVAWALTCPHWLGPLGEEPDAQGQLVCPWHGYRFDVRSGRSCDGRALRLAPAARVEVDGGRALLVVGDHPERA